MILIVGAGISGLFTGYELLKKGYKFVILEKGDRVGGKIESIKYDNYIIEGGPSVINENQHTIITLCQELRIGLEYTKSKFFSYSKTVDTTKLGKKDGSKVEDVLTDDNIATFYENKDMIYNDWLEAVKNEGKYMYLKKGFLHLVKRLYKILNPYIFKGTLLKIYNGQSETLPIMVDMKCSDDKVKRFTFYKIILCTTMNQLYSIQFEKSLLPKTPYTKTIQSLRVYVILDKQSSVLNNIFSNYNVIYNKQFGLTIKISEYIILLIYTDNEHALEMSKEHNIKKAMKFYGLDKHIKEVKTYLYKDAFDVITSNKDINIKLENRIYQSAFPDRKNQCWLEGNLVRCKEIVKSIT